jgi:hypothetical protein
MKRLSLFFCVFLFAIDAGAARYVLLIGINDYTASRLGTPPKDVPQRDWDQLTGAVIDVEMLQQMLVALYGVDSGRIVTLTDQAATRAAILQSLEHLAAVAQKDDAVLFYFGGHGSQVRNSRSEERDKLDESIVPADSRLGVGDIRDKELRTYFNRILDRGAHLTVILDNCHSGSGARGLANGSRARGVRSDPRDVADGIRYGARPESRGALVLAATQDNDAAWETRDAEGKPHGVFTWAWMRAMRDASSGEPAVETFERAQARMRAETPFQSPVIAGLADVKLAPFLGERIDRHGERTVVAVAKVQSDDIALQGGWANGLAVGSELKDPQGDARLTITAVRGLTQSVARVVFGTPPKPGALLEVVGWAAPPGPPLRVSIARTTRSIKSIAQFARALNEEAVQHGVRWVADPIESTASHVLRWRPDQWELVGPSGVAEYVGSDDAALAAVARMPPATSLFVQLPVPAEIAGAIDAQSVAPEEADYLLVGRYARKSLSYAWVRPLMKRSDRRRSGLPPRTKWMRADLGRALSHLRRIHAWLTLESPPPARFPYRLQIRRERDERLVGEGESIIGGDSYKLALRGTMPLPAKVNPRYVYAFVIDSDGRSALLFPPSASGSVENRFPDAEPLMDIPLDGSTFEASEPYGIDTFVLLTTDEPLPDPAILEWDAVRSAKPTTALEELLVLTASGSRAKSCVTPASWSIERVSYESIASRATKEDR